MALDKSIFLVIVGSKQGSKVPEGRARKTIQKGCGNLYMNEVSKSLYSVMVLTCAGFTDFKIYLKWREKFRILNARKMVVKCVTKPKRMLIHDKEQLFERKITFCRFGRKRILIIVSFFGMKVAAEKGFNWFQ